MIYWLISGHLSFGLFHKLLSHEGLMSLHICLPSTLWPTVSVLSCHQELALYLVIFCTTWQKGCMILMWSSKTAKGKIRLVTCLAFFRFYIFLICFHFCNAFIGMHELSFEGNISKNKEKYCCIEVILYIRVPVLQTKTSVNIWLCRCIVTL